MIKHSGLVVFMIQTLFFCGAAFAASLSLPNTQVVNLDKSINGIEYQLYIHVPDACAKPKKTCQAVYLLDADYSFPLSTQIVTHLSDRNRIPPVVSIGIAYPDKSQYRLNRTRDYTPFFVADGGYGKAAQALSGGGPAFLDVLKKEIIPWVEKHYSVSSQGRTLVGHSYGGLFALYAWLLSPDVFSNYTIVSPSLWYGGKVALKEVMRRCLASYSGTRHNIFLAVGEYEEQPQNNRSMVSDLKQLSDLLSTCKSRKVNVYSRVFEDETHASIFPAAYSTSIRKHFQ